MVTIPLTGTVREIELEVLEVDVPEIAAGTILNSSGSTSNDTDCRRERFWGLMSRNHFRQARRIIVVLLFVVSNTFDSVEVTDSTGASLP